MAESLFNRLGGLEAIMAASDLFYEKVLADEVTRPFFHGVDMAKQTQKLVAFMAWAFGGPDEFKGRDLREAHKHLVLEQKLSDVHFDAVAKHLIATLQELGVAQPLIDESIAIVATTKNAVLNR